MWGLLRPAPHAAPLPASAVDREYTKQRTRVFAGIFIGYAAYYLVRNNLALAIPDILTAHPEYSKAQLGTALTGLSIAYGLSKFLMGSVSDRSNPKYFLPLGLLLSCAIIVACGFDWVYTSLGFLIGLMVLNGWVQGMGWLPCGKTMALVQHQGTWAHRRHLNVSHAWRRPRRQLRPGGRDDLRRLGREVLLTRPSPPSAPSASFLLQDTPQSCGLPPSRTQERLPARLQRGSRADLHVQGNLLRARAHQQQTLWAIAIANAFVYFVRYGVVNWIPTYLEHAKGFSFKESSTAWALYEYAAIPGTLACGWVSDRWFKGRRAPANILFMALTLVAVVVYWMNIKGPLWIDYAALIAIGFLIYGPIMIIGLHALDLVPKKAVGRRDSPGSLVTCSARQSPGRG
jgi:OPA family glycerol-3-phosphate transporter-like MFS transporter